MSPGERRRIPWAEMTFATTTAIKANAFATRRMHGWIFDGGCVCSGVGCSSFGSSSAAAT